MTDETSNYIQAFRQSLPYINAHRGKTFVIMLDGEAMLGNTFTSIVHDIALLNSLGVRIVLVAGSRPQIDAALALQGITTDFQLGRRITSQIALEVIKHVTGKCRFELEAQFSNGLPNTPMHHSNTRIVSGNFVTAKPLGVLEGYDFQFTGGVRKVDIQAINTQLGNGAIVLAGNIAYSATAECFNLAAEEVAVAIAIALKADKFIAYTNAAQLQSLPREIMPNQAKSLLNDELTSLGFAIQACEAGVQRSHLINYETDGSLLVELFTTDGIGTLISRDAFEYIRPATINDVGGIMNL